jgi:LuxR family transcriptional regulator, maltose regulon positive regulatory protein
VTPLLATKLYLPLLRPKLVSRPHLIKRLNDGAHHKLTLVSAPAGFGKTTLVSTWLTGYSQPTAWLSLDEGENDLTCFLRYLIAALQTIVAKFGEGVLESLYAPQPPPSQVILTDLLNDITTISDPFVLVLDDYHMIDAKPVEHAISFLLEHLPPQMHLVIVTREDPRLPLARLRARDLVTELRAADLRFTSAEAAEFLNQVMGLPLSAEDVAALEARTEGWIAGLQFAALALQRHEDTTGFIRSFTGSHQFVLDYLVEEVLAQQDIHVQTFLLRTSILDRLCGPLCDAVLLAPAASSQAMLDYLDHANLFLVSLDHERRWYRYHHLFAELLRLRLHQSIAASSVDGESQVRELHVRASAWYESQGLVMEAFHHAGAAHDVERAEHLMGGTGIPLHFRGAVTVLLDWLASLPITVLDARPSLWVRYATLLLVDGQTTGVEEKLRAAEDALRDIEADGVTRDLIGQIAKARATLALTRYQLTIVLDQSHRALEYLDPNNLPFRATTHWTLGITYLFLGDRAEARQSLTSAISLSKASKERFTTLLATIGLGNVQEADTQLTLAAETYRHVLQMAGDQPSQMIYEAHLGLARIYYEWNDLESAEQHGQQSLHLAQQYDQAIDRFILCEVFLARLKLTQGDVAGAAALLSQSSQSAHQYHFVHRMPDIAAVQVLVLLRQGLLSAADSLAQSHDLPLSQARVYLAQGNSSAALAVLSTWRRQVESRKWADELLKVMVLQVLVLEVHGEHNEAMLLLRDALRIAEPDGFIRLFLDEGPSMAYLLSQADVVRMMPDYVGKLLTAWKTDVPQRAEALSRPPTQPLIEPLSQRELEVLHLIAQGLSNQEISERLFLTLGTVKGHNQKIFGKLQVQRRTEAVARARELGLL